MILSILGIALFWGILYFPKKNYIGYVIVFLLSLLWLVSTQLAGWQDHWWFMWIISPLVLSIIYCISNKLSKIIFYYKKYSNRIMELDELLDKTPLDMRNKDIDVYILKSIRFYSSVKPNETITKENLPFVIQMSLQSNASTNERPGYLLAESYAYLYCLDNISQAVQFGKLTLLELSCYNKDHIILNMYKWLYKEERIAKYLFDENGNSKIENSAL